MSRIELAVDHTLPMDAALARMHALADYYIHRHGATVQWDHGVGDIHVKYIGVKLLVRVKVDSHCVHCEAPDPGFLLRRRGLDYLRKKLTRYLDPATPVELLPRG